MIRRFFALTLIFAAALLVGPRAAHAQTEAELARAVELKTQGDALVHALHYREALVAYDGAFQISHDPAILYNRGRALDALGETPQALDALEEFIRVAPASLKGRVPKLDELVASVRARVATVVVHCPVEGASVFVRRRLEGTTPLVAPLRVPTGAAWVEVQAAGYQPYLVEMNLDGGAPTILDVALVPAPAAGSVPPAPAAGAPDTDPAPTEKPGGGAWKVAAYSTGAAGVAGATTGAVFGVLALTRRNGADADCPAGRCNPAGSAMIADARTFAAVSTISFVVGGVALATSVLFFLWKPGHPGEHARLVPVLAPNFAGIAGAF